jgi:hypothetical protein
MLQRLPRPKPQATVHSLAQQLRTQGWTIEIKRPWWHRPQLWQVKGCRDGKGFSFEQPEGELRRLLGEKLKEGRLEPVAEDWLGLSEDEMYGPFDLEDFH